jgi:hypothetical protein
MTGSFLVDRAEGRRIVPTVNLFRGRAVTQKAYRLMHAIMTTAVEDEVSRGHPWRVKGVGQLHSGDRRMSPIATLGSGGVDIAGLTMSVDCQVIEDR